jgi:hypothetical protein
MTTTTSKISCLMYAVGILSSLIGCGQKDHVAADSLSIDARDARQAIRSTDDLRRLLTLGRGTNEVVKSFGEPYERENLEQGLEMWHYNIPPFPADDTMARAYVTGVSLVITNGRLANWACSYQGAAIPSNSRRHLTSNRTNQLTTKLEFFVVNSDPFVGARLIDTQRFPKLGYVSSSPVLTITKLKDVILEQQKAIGPEKNDVTVWSFGIFLSQEDGVRLKTLTATNISKRILIMIGDEPASAPIIKAPLESGSFEVQGEDRLWMEAVSEQLARMDRQP